MPTVAPGAVALGGVGGGGFPLSAPQAGHLAASFAVPAAAPGTFMSTGILAPGTWNITCTVSAIGSASVLAECDIQAIAGTATAALEGGCSAGVAIDAPGSPVAGLALAFQAIVTIAGTIAFQTQAGQPGDWTIEPITSQFGFPKATGWTANRIA
jgi:hypothetical protein